MSKIDKQECLWGQKNVPCPLHSLTMCGMGISWKLDEARQFFLYFNFIVIFKLKF